MQSTSLNAYQEIKKTLAGKRMEVYAILYEPLTNEEIADRLGWKINCVTGRIFELREKRLVTEAGLKRSATTNKLAKLWRKTTLAEQEQREEQLAFL